MKSFVIITVRKIEYGHFVGNGIIHTTIPIGEIGIVHSVDDNEYWTEFHITEEGKKKTIKLGICSDEFYRVGVFYHPSEDICRYCPSMEIPRPGEYWCYVLKELLNPHMVFMNRTDARCPAKKKEVYG